jgi:hypothetical protein
MSSGSVVGIIFCALGYMMVGGLILGACQLSYVLERAKLHYRNYRILQFWVILFFIIGLILCAIDMTVTIAIVGRAL